MHEDTPWDFVTGPTSTMVVPCGAGAPARPQRSCLACTSCLVYEAEVGANPEVAVGRELLVRGGMLWAQKLVMQRPGKYGVTRRAQVPPRSFDRRAAGEASPRRMEVRAVWAPTIVIGDVRR